MGRKRSYKSMWRQRLGWCVYKQRNSKVSSNHQKLGEKQETDSLSESPEGTNPWWQLDSELVASGTVREWTSVVPNHPVCGILYGSPKKLIQVKSPTRRGQEEELQRGTRKLLGVMDMFTIFTVAMVSRVYNMSKYELYTLNMHSLLYVNYI